MLMHPEEVASLPIWVAAGMLAGLAVATAVVIELVARRVIPLGLRQDHNSVASPIFSVIGTTYAVLLAFVAMLAWDGFNKAQDVTDNEASLVQSAYQLIDGLDGPGDGGHAPRHRGLCPRRGRHRMAGPGARACPG